MMYTQQGFQRFRKTDKADRKRAMPEHFAHFLIVIQLIAVNPYALTHQERIIVDFFLRLYFKPFQKLFHNKVNFMVKLLKEPVNIFICQYCNTRQIYAGKAKVAAPCRNFPLRVVYIANDACTAAHICNFRFRVPFLIIFQIIRRILEREIREQPFRAIICSYTFC